VGITGLKEAIEELQGLKGRPEAEIAQALLDELKPKNYIPAAAREEYMRAFLREFKKALGEEVAEEKPGGLVVKILGPGCPNCEALERMVIGLASELGLPAAVEHIRDLKEIHALGVFGVPALVINDDIKAVGRLPDRETLKQWLLEANR
jgi:small redox-active disulfide protein 2